MQAIAYWKHRADLDAADEHGDTIKHRRHLSVSPGWDGEIVINGALDPVGGEIFKTELDRICQQLRLADLRDGVERSTQQRRTDALVEMAMRSATAPADGLRPKPLFTVTIGIEPRNHLCETAAGTILAPGLLMRCSPTPSLSGSSTTPRTATSKPHDAATSPVQSVGSSKSATATAKSSTAAPNPSRSATSTTSPPTPNTRSHATAPDKSAAPPTTESSKTNGKLPKKQRRGDPLPCEHCAPSGPPPHPTTKRRQTPAPHPPPAERCSPSANARLSRFASVTPKLDLESNGKPLVRACVRCTRRADQRSTAGRHVRRTHPNIPRQQNSSARRGACRKDLWRADNAHREQRTASPPATGHRSR